MTKQHFELLAETVANMPRIEGRETTENSDVEVSAVELSTLIRELGDMCAGTNGLFDRGRFERACYTPNYRAPKNVTRY